jgi:hypothetical protein
MMTGGGCGRRRDHSSQARTTVWRAILPPDSATARLLGSRLGHEPRLGVRQMADQCPAENCQLAVAEIKLSRPLT